MSHALLGIRQIILQVTSLRVDKLRDMNYTHDLGLSLALLGLRPLVGALVAELSAGSLAVELPVDLDASAIGFLRGERRHLAFIIWTSGPMHHRARHDGCDTWANVIQPGAADRSRRPEVAAIDDAPHTPVPPAAKINASIA